MKAALANIGEKEKSMAASALEYAGLNGDKEFIAANTGSFIESLEVLIKKISQAETAPNENVVQQEDRVYLVEQLQIIKSACEDYNDEAAFAALDRLKEKPWKKQTTDALEKIRDMLYLHSDFDGAAGQMKTLLKENNL